MVAAQIVPRIASLPFGFGCAVPKPSHCPPIAFTDPSRDTRRVRLRTPLANCSRHKNPTVHQFLRQREREREREREEGGGGEREREREREREERKKSSTEMDVRISTGQVS